MPSPLAFKFYVTVPVLYKSVLDKWCSSHKKIAYSEISETTDNTLTYTLVFFEPKMLSNLKTLLAHVCPSDIQIAPQEIVSYSDFTEEHHRVYDKAFEKAVHECMEGNGQYILSINRLLGCVNQRVPFLPMGMTPSQTLTKLGAIVKKPFVFDSERVLFIQNL